MLSDLVRELGDILKDKIKFSAMSISAISGFLFYLNEDYFIQRNQELMENFAKHTFASEDEYSKRLNDLKSRYMEDMTHTEEKLRKEIILSENRIKTLSEEYVKLKEYCDNLFIFSKAIQEKSNLIPCVGASFFDTGKPQLQQFSYVKCDKLFSQYSKQLYDEIMERAEYALPFVMVADNKVFCPRCLMEEVKVVVKVRKDEGIREYYNQLLEAVAVWFIANGWDKKKAEYETKLESGEIKSNKEAIKEWQIPYNFAFYQAMPGLEDEIASRVLADEVAKHNS